MHWRHLPSAWGGRWPARCAAAVLGIHGVPDHLRLGHCPGAPLRQPTHQVRVWIQKLVERVTFLGKATKLWRGKKGKSRGRTSHCPQYTVRKILHKLILLPRTSWRFIDALFSRTAAAFPQMLHTILRKLFFFAHCRIPQYWPTINIQFRWKNFKMNCTTIRTLEDYNLWNIFTTLQNIS